MKCSKPFCHKKALKEDASKLSLSHDPPKICVEQYQITWYVFTVSVQDVGYHIYRYSNKHRSAYLIFHVSCAALIWGWRLFEGGPYLISLLQQLEGRERGRLVLSYRQSLQPSRWTDECEDFEERTEWKSIEIYSCWTEKHLLMKVNSHCWLRTALQRVQCIFIILWKYSNKHCTEAAELINFSTPCAALNRGRRLFGGGTYSRKYGNLFDLWKIGSNRKPDPSKEEHPNSEMKKVIFEKFQPTWKKEFPWFKFDKEKKEMFCIVCHKYLTVADIAGQLCVGINGSCATCFRCDSLVSHEKRNSCFQWFKNEEKPKQALLQQIAVKLTKSWRGNWRNFSTYQIWFHNFFWQVNLT